MNPGESDLISGAHRHHPLGQVDPLSCASKLRQLCNLGAMELLELLNLPSSNFSMNPAGGLKLGLSAQFGDDVDFDNTRPARSVTWLPSVQFRLGRHLDVNTSFEDSRLWIKDGRLYDARLAQTRIVYQFNVRTFVRAIIQYQDIERDPSLYLFDVDSRQRNLFGQFLFSYKINPQTVLFTGYTNSQVGAFGIPLTQTDRTFFLKIGYALLF